MKKKCLKCGKTFSHNYNVWCFNCISESLSEQIYKAPEKKSFKEETKNQTERESFDYDVMFNYDCNPVNKPKARKKPKIYADIKAADKLHISYGEYMARKAKGKL